MTGWNQPGFFLESRQRENFGNKVATATLKWWRHNQLLSPWATRFSNKCFFHSSFSNFIATSFWREIYFHATICMKSKNVFKAFSPYFSNRDTFTIQRLYIKISLCFSTSNCKGYWQCVILLCQFLWNTQKYLSCGLVDNESNNRTNQGSI